ncbi:MAG: pyridoxal 5'-phosphate synthase glutaminase subunit PdxT [Acidimicrobiales bacterium]
MALQGDVREHAAMLEAVGARPVPVRRIEELDSIDGLVIPGGESTTISMLLVSSGLLEPLRARIASGLPVLGTCAGMILLATDVVGGRADQVSLAGIDMAVRRNAFGRQVESFECELDVEGVAGGPMHAVFIRAPYVEQVGDGVEVLASVSLPDAVSSNASTRPVVCKQGSVIVASFHPELAGDVRLHAMLLGLVRAVAD